jgi:hypothetical protein
MSTGRLTFLYPHLFRSASRLGEPSAHQVGRAVPTGRKPARSPAPAASHDAVRFASTSSRPRQSSTYASKRHGKAVEPLPVHAVPKNPPATSKQDAPAVEQKADKGAEQVRDVKTEAKPEAKQASKPETKQEPKPEPKEETEDTKMAQAQTPDETDNDSLPEVIAAYQSPSSASPADSKSHEGPLETILHMPPPPSSDQATSDSPGLGGEKTPPHLTPPPYVHHFDSYSLVKQLEDGGWTRAQAITAMKAVRGLLAGNLSVAEAGLVSKSDIENETYLFRAACSELSTEVRNNRRVADEGLRQQRTLLQHEADILAQRLNQELLTLNDDVRGMFNDRRMAVREEQKAAESAVSDSSLVP